LGGMARDGVDANEHDGPRNVGWGANDFGVKEVAEANADSGEGNGEAHAIEYDADGFTAVNIAVKEAD